MADVEDDIKVVDLENQVTEDVDFSKLKKKKKKSKPAAEKEEVAEPAPVEDAAPAEAEGQTATPAEGEDLDSMFGDLKKKKKKKKVDVSEDEVGSAAGTSEAVDAEFDGLKKKRRGKKTTMAEFEEALKGEEEDATLVGISFGDGDEAESAGNDGRELWLGSNRDYTYGELLGRVFLNLRQNNPDLVGEKKKYTIVPPSIHREPKKTIFANLVDICRRMHRQPEHFIQFLFAELGTTGSVDGEQRLVIKGKFTQKQIEAIIRRYIMDYVQCKTCKSPDTILIKENRLFFQQCESCNSTRSVAAIKSGFKAQTEKRAAQRRAAG